MVEGDEVDLAGLRPRQPVRAARCQFDMVPPGLERALNEAPEAGIVVDVEDAAGGGGRVAHEFSGT